MVSGASLSCLEEKDLGTIINAFTAFIVRKGLIYVVKDLNATEPLPIGWNDRNSLVLINAGVWIL
jgi:hypothetical protein